MAVQIGLAQWLGSDAPDGAGIDGLTWADDETATIFVDDLPSSPDHAVAVYGNGGFEADAGLPYDAPVVQLIVRSDAGPAWGIAMWEAIYSKLHALRNKTLPDGTELVYALVVQSSPIHLRTDDNDRHEYSMNVRTETRNPTEERPA